MARVDPGGRLSGKVVIVTGAGSGIGRATALRLAEEGARLVVNDVYEDRATTVAKEVEQRGGEALPYPADVSRREEVDALVDATVERFGRLDVLVNNAAAPIGGSLEEVSDEDWQRVQEVTLNGTFYGLRAALRVLVAQGQGGAIINVSSGAAVGGEPGLGAYAAAKAAVVNLTKTAAIENGPHGIRVNALLPGPIRTPPLLAAVEATGGEAAWRRQIPARRLGEPEEMANVILFLASDEASYVNGAAIIADGGIAARTAAPRFDD